MPKNRIYLFTVAFSLSLCLVHPLFSSPADAARTYRVGTTYSKEFRLADQFLQTGRYDQAEKQYLTLLKKNPKNSAARSGLALAQAELYKLDAAEKNAKEALAQNSKNAMAHAALGIIARNRTASLDMFYRGQREQGLAQSAQSLETASRIEPKSPEIHNQLGVTYRFQGRYQDAFREFEQALKLDPDFSEALLNQGISKLDQGDVSGAKSVYTRAIKLNSKNHMAHYRLGEALLKQGDPHQALNSFNTALALNPNNASILAKMAEAYDAQGNTSAAVTTYRKAMHANPSYMPAYVGIANLYDSRGDGELAMAELKSALNVNPKFNQARNQLGRLALVVDKPDQALQYYKESLQQNPNDPEALQGLSQTLTLIAQKTSSNSQALGVESDLVSAEQAIQEALRINPNDMRLHLASLRISQLAGKPQASQAELQQIAAYPARHDSEKMIQGEALLALGRYSEADQVFTGLMNQSRQSADKLLIIGDTLKANGDLQRARQAYQMASQAEPGNLKAERGIQRIEKAEAEAQKTYRLAKALNNWRQRESSVDYYEETLSQNPRQPEARLALAKLYEKYRQYDKAILSYQFYLGLRPDMPEKEKQSILKKISKLETLANKSENHPAILTQANQ